jgi:peptidyl-prolyl cis-trans isomerase D
VERSARVGHLIASRCGALVEAVLRADPAKLPSFVGVDLGAGGYALVRVDKVLPRADQTPEQQAQSRTRYDQLWGVAEARSYYDLLKARYKAEILVPAVAAPTAQSGTPAAAASR